MGVGTWSIEGQNHPYVIKEWPLSKGMISFLNKNYQSRIIIWDFIYRNPDGDWVWSSDSDDADSDDDDEETPAGAHASPAANQETPSRESSEESK